MWLVQPIPKGISYMHMRDALGMIYQDESFAHLFPQNGRAVEAPWRLAFITVVQFIEGLPDRQAADAVRGRIDLKYALGLELTDPGFDFSILSEFRKRLLEGGAEQVLLDAMLAVFKERGWLKQRRAPTEPNSTHVLAKVRAINRLMCVGEAMRFALNSLAVVAGEWLLAHSDPEVGLTAMGIGLRGSPPTKPRGASDRGGTHRSRWFELVGGYLCRRCPCLVA